MFKQFIFLTLISLILSIPGCVNESEMMQPEIEDYLKITPKDGETSVRLDQAIELQFYKPVDKTIVENDFHLISSRDMADSSCPVSNGMNHSQMNTAMLDSLKMNHLAMQHHSVGTFIWLSDDKCIFKPDSLLMPNMEYMIQIGSSMMNMMQQQMGNMMMNNMGTMNHGMMMMHFVTIDTTSGGGHDDHH